MASAFSTDLLSFIQLRRKVWKIENSQLLVEAWPSPGNATSLGNRAIIRFSNLAFMTPQELFPEKWSKLVEEKIKRDKSKYEINMEAATDEFKCFKCKKRKCT